MPRKTALADRYLAAIQSPCNGDSNTDDHAANVDSAGKREVRIEYTYRPPSAANADNNTTGVIEASADGNSPKLPSTAGVVHPTSSTEEETTTDEEDLKVNRLESLVEYKVNEVAFGEMRS